MEKRYNFDNLEASFKNFLLAGNKTSVTIKNYLSDLRHFLGWFVLKFKTESSKFKYDAEPQNIVQIITIEAITEYNNYLIANKIPERTIKRRISTLAKFSSFCINQGWIKENPIKQLRISDIKAKLPLIDRVLNEYKEISSLEDYNNINNFISFVKS